MATPPPTLAPPPPQEKSDGSSFSNPVWQRWFSAVSLSFKQLVSALASSYGASLLGFIQDGVGAMPWTVQARLREWVNVKDFGAVCDGVTDDSAAVQKALNYCLSFQRARPLLVSGRCRIASSLIVNRPVDNTSSEFRLVGHGEGAGFYTTGSVVLFDSSLTFGGIDPVSEFLCFENLQFETNSIFHETFVLSPKFLRCKFLNCNFRLMRCLLTPTYAQSLYFLACNIRNTKASFINCVGLYDVLFHGCIIENGSTLVRAVDAARGTNGLRITNNVIEGIQSSVVVATGLAGFVYENNHCESNFSPEINTFAGGVMNRSVTIKGNYVYNPGGPMVYHGPTNCVTSTGNTVFPSMMHSNAPQVEQLLSSGDYCAGGISDATIYSTIAGITSSGSVTRSWGDSQNHLNKTTDGRFGFGAAALAGVRAHFAGSAVGTDYTLACLTSGGFSSFLVRNDKVIEAPGLLAVSYANDAAAAAAGIPVGGLYRTVNAVQIRLV